ncbi:MAG: hypothetical protein FRX48_09441 [Lasallia pustulata]|uniref:Uncharacterized protein n=1 Tax=Lasallia pustulata TaxID=136370 RepID=A0A5M8PCQ7_9LECA|nr:MAG: hypothetical protein FRX48_09441 [Lasallia pustulata]
MALAEYGIPSDIQLFSSPDYKYPCRNGCGTMVHIQGTLCDRCTAGGGPPFNNAGHLELGLGHEARGLSIRHAGISAIPRSSDHGCGSYSCKYPGRGNRVQERGDLCQTCMAGA